MTILKSKQVSLLSDTTPVGTVIFTSALEAPTGYIVCNGAEVSRTVYNNLWTVTGARFGAGDGSTTFALPNLTGTSFQGVSLLPCVKY